MALLDLIRRPKAAKKTDLKGMFVPVIFATGQDDDLPGLVAALKNEAVQYGDRIYKPDEDIAVVGHRNGNGAICLSCDHIYVVGPDQNIHTNIAAFGWSPSPESVVVNIPQGMRRHVSITDNDIFMNWKGPK